MNTSNLPNRALRQSEVGMVWEEKISGAQSSIEIPMYATFRVRATGASTVTVDGVLAATMSTGEIMIFNAGQGIPSNNGDTKRTVTVAIGAANAFVQVGRTVELANQIITY